MTTTELDMWSRRSSVIEGSTGFHRSFHPELDEWDVRLHTAKAFDDLHGPMRSTTHLHRLRDRIIRITRTQYEDRKSIPVDEIKSYGRS